FEYEDDEVTTVTVGPLDGKDVQLLRVVSEHLDRTLVEFLVQATQSQAPVTSSRYFLARALRTVKDTEVFATIYGGRYYELTGIKRTNKQGSDLDNLLESLGIGNVKEKRNFKKVFDELRSDARVAVFRSGVTGKPRQVLILPSLSGRVTDTERVVILTLDL